MRRVRLTNDSLNSYGTRILTSGMNVTQYEKNPVLLYMHERGNVIGYVKDIKVEDNEITGELVFDEATELSKRCKKQFEFGSLRMVSVGIDILEFSDDSSLLAEGQTRHTITKSKLTEVSLVDVGANDDAIVLKYEGKQLTLGKGGDNHLPILSNNKSKRMEEKVLALQLGLPETASLEQINAKIGKLKLASEQFEKMQTEMEELKAARITSVVETAILEKRIGEDKKDQFLRLGKQVGAEELQNTFSAMSPRIKFAEALGHQGGAPQGKATYQKLSEVPADKMLELREKNKDEYARLYKAEYGIECVFE